MAIAEAIVTDEERTGAALQLTEPQTGDMSRDQYQTLMAQARHLLDGGFVPSALKRPEQVLHILLKARELGIPGTYALSNIAIIDGKPAAGAELMLALIYRAYGGNAIRVIETSRDKCVVRYQRPEWPDASQLVWTIQDAQDAGLSGVAWKKYPATMLRWRAISAAAKLGFPEVIGGLYTAEELGGSVRIDSAGEAYIDAVSTPAPQIEMSEESVQELAGPQPPRHETIIPTEDVSDTLPKPSADRSQRIRQEREFRTLCREIGQDATPPIDWTAIRDRILEVEEIKGKTVPQLTSEELERCIARAREHAPKPADGQSELGV